MNQDGLGFQVVAGMDFHFDLWSVWLSFLLVLLGVFFPSFLFRFDFLSLSKTCLLGLGNSPTTYVVLFIDQPSFFLYDEEKRHMRAEGACKWYQSRKGAAVI